MTEIPDRESPDHTDGEPQTAHERAPRQYVEEDLKHRGDFAPWWRRDLPRKGMALTAAAAAAVAFHYGATAIGIFMVATVAAILVGRESFAAQSDRRHRNSVTDTKVFFAVRRDPGHCCMTYANATGLPDHVVRPALRRLTDDGLLRTEQTRPLEHLPLVTVYHSVVTDEEHRD